MKAQTVRVSLPCNRKRDKQQKFVGRAKTETCVPGLIPAPPKAFHLRNPELDTQGSLSPCIIAIFVVTANLWVFKAGAYNIDYTSLFSTI